LGLACAAWPRFFSQDMTTTSGACWRTSLVLFCLCRRDTGWPVRCLLTLCYTGACLLCRGTAAVFGGILSAGFSAERNAGRHAAGSHLPRCVPDRTWRCCADADSMTFPTKTTVFFTTPHPTAGGGRRVCLCGVKFIAAALCVLGWRGGGRRVGGKIWTSILRADRIFDFLPIQCSARCMCISAGVARSPSACIIVLSACICGTLASPGLWTRRSRSGRRGVQARKSTL